MQAIDVTRHSRITQQVVPSTTALSFVCCSQFACKKKLLMTFGTTLVHLCFGPFSFSGPTECKVHLLQRGQTYYRKRDDEEIEGEWHTHTEYVMLASLRHRFVVTYSKRRSQSLTQLLCYNRHVKHSSRQQCERTFPNNSFTWPMWVISVPRTFSPHSIYETRRNNRIVLHSLRSTTLLEKLMVAS